MQQAGDRTNNRTATPWHLWLVGIFFLATYAMGARDYVLCLTVSEAYFESQGWHGAVAYFTDYPLVPLVFWTTGLAAGLAAPAALLLRSRWAVPIALAAALAQLLLQISTFGSMDRWSMLGPEHSLFDIGVMLSTFALWWYCRAMRTRSVLG